MGQMKKLLLAVFVCVIGVLCTGPAQTYAADMQKAEIATMKDASELETIDAMYTQTCALTNSKDDVQEDYFSFTLAKDSWVYLGGSFSLYDYNGASTHITIYTNSSMSNKKADYGFGYWEYTKSINGIWKAGTYYVYVRTYCANYSSFNGNVNIIAGAIPTDKIFTYSTKVSKNKSSATVTMTCALGDYAKYVQFRPDTKGVDDVTNKTYWKTVTSGYFFNGDSSTQVLEKTNGGYSATVTKNGKVTFLIMMSNEERYAGTYKVSGIDSTKPTVSGVKNGKTYKSAVTIKFSDKGSGIKSAKLNGKTIKTGKKVSKNGTYKLVVTDKAGNKKTVKFTIKK
jgi:hypothetical protein